MISNFPFEQTPKFHHASNKSVTHLMQQAISRNNDDAIPLWEQYLSDELSGMVLTL